jgi:hypothetical protein
MTLPKLQQWVGRIRRYHLEVSSHPLPFVAGALTGAVIIGLLWLFPSGRSDSQPGFLGAAAVVDAPSPGGSTGTPESTPTREPAATAPSPDRLESCQRVFAALAGPLRAVPGPLSQWQVHIGAMNKLVTGVITLKQATQFWNQTRVGAAQGLARYRSALDTFAARTVRCPRTRDETLTTAALQCTEAVAARARELATAERSLATWRIHVRHMEMLRKGEMTPAQATRLWLASWHKGVRELSAYRAAARQASGRTC